MGFKPGKLSNRQRDYITAASHYTDDGEELPLADVYVRVGDWQQVNGLIKRGLMVERDCGFFYLTKNGRQVAEAIERLRNRP